MLLRSLLLLGLTTFSAISSEATFTELQLGDVRLPTPTAWAIKERYTEIGIYPPDQPPQGSPRRIHLDTQKNVAGTLEATVEEVFNRADIKQRQKRAGSGGLPNKDITSIQTKSGRSGLRAIFYDLPMQDPPKDRHYSIVYYFFEDGEGGIIRVCSHVYGDQKTFDTLEQAILTGLRFGKSQ